MNVSETIQIHQALKDVIDKGKDLKAYVKYRLLKNLRKTKKSDESFNELKREYIVANGTKDGTGNYKIEPENMDKYNEYMNELLDKEDEPIEFMKLFMGANKDDCDLDNLSSHHLCLIDTVIFEKETSE